MDKFILKEKSYMKIKPIKDGDKHEQIDKIKIKHGQSYIDRPYIDEIKHEQIKHEQIKHEQIKHEQIKKDKAKDEHKDEHKRIKYIPIDKFMIEEKGDIVINKWLKNKTDPIVVFLSEFIPNTKISKELQKFKPIVKTTPIISIEEYRKKKKIGEEGVKYLKKLKEKYGNIVLKVLWANLNF